MFGATLHNAADTVLPCLNPVDAFKGLLLVLAVSTLHVTTLQVGRWRVLFPVGLEIFYRLNPSSRTTALGSTQPLTEMSTRGISWGVKAAGA
jgi:hypothetical protein